MSIHLRFSPILPSPFSVTRLPSYHTCALPTTRRKALSLFTFTSIFTGLGFSDPNQASSKPTISDFVELPDSGGVKALDLRVGEGGDTPVDGDKVSSALIFFSLFSFLL